MLPTYTLPRCPECGHFLEDDPDEHDCREACEQWEESQAEWKADEQAYEERGASS